MSLNMADLRIAKLVILQFKQYIRTLVFSSVYYLDMDRETFDAEFRREAYTEYEIDMRHADHAFKLYQITRENQQESIKTGLSSAYLSFALTSCPSIRRIVLTDLSSSRSMSRESLQVLEPRRSECCPVEGCGWKDTDHFPLAVRQSGFSRKGSSNPCCLILQALSVTNSSVSELAMVPEDVDISANTSAFSMSPGELRQSTLCFHALTKICLFFGWDPERFATDDHVRHTHRNLAKLLGCAVNLECLVLLAYEDTGEYQLCPLQDVVGWCKFPKLRSLILGFFEFTEVELLKLLTHSKGLQQLTIECSALKEGLWARIVDWARASLPYLERARLNQLYDGFEDPWAHTEYMDLYGNISDFLFGQGKNPFTTEALAKYHADRKMGREVTPGGGESYRDICDRYY